MGIIFYRCASGGYKSLARNQLKPDVATPVVANTNGNGHVVVTLFPMREPMRVPNDWDTLVKRYGMYRKRCRGQKPRYKETRRGLGRATQNYML